jgi:hypothetical protein
VSWGDRREAKGVEENRRWDGCKVYEVVQEVRGNQLVYKSDK